jgi:hypothetical protein
VLVALAVFPLTPLELGWFYESHGPAPLRVLGHRRPSFLAGRCDYALQRLGPKRMRIEIHKADPGEGAAPSAVPRGRLGCLAHLRVAAGAAKIAQLHRLNPAELVGEPDVPRLGWR